MLYNRSLIVFTTPYLEGNMPHCTTNLLYYRRRHFPTNLLICQVIASHFSWKRSFIMRVHVSCWQQVYSCCKVRAAVQVYSCWQPGCCTSVQQLYRCTAADTQAAVQVYSSCTGVQLLTARLLYRCTAAAKSGQAAGFHGPINWLLCHSIISTETSCSILSIWQWQQLWCFLAC